MLYKTNISIINLFIFINFSLVTVTTDFLPTLITKEET